MGQRPLTKVVGMALAWASAFLGAASAAAGRAELPIAFVQAPRVATRGATSESDNSILAGRYVAGMRIVLADLPNVGSSIRVATEGFMCASDPAFNPEGTRLVFAGKRTPQDHFQIWELGGGDLEPQRKVTCRADCFGPVYLPNREVVFASSLSREYEEHGGRLSLSLYATGTRRGAPERLTFNPSSDFEPVVLPDGRILYSSWQHVGNHYWPRGLVGLMLVNSDGTGVFPLTGNHRTPWLKRGATPWTNDRIALIQSEEFGDFGAGTLVATSLNDPFGPYEVLIPPDDYEVSDVSALPGGKLLLSARPVQAPETTFGLYVYDQGEVRLLYDDPAHHELAPVVGGSHERPELRISTVVPDTPYGYLTILDCYQSDRTDQHPLRPDSVHVVRVIEGRPLRAHGGKTPEFLSLPGREDEPLVNPNSASGYIPSRILGEVPPATDGSLYLKVPADRPLRVQLIDRDGFAIVNERAWFWVRPNERRVCIGCHENRELAPSNAVPLATRHTPTDLTDPSTWQSVSFRRDIQPILSANCATADCHVPPTPTAGLNQTAYRLNGDKDAVLANRFGPAYANHLARQKNKPFAIGGRRVHPGNARSSPLLWMLYGRALAPQYRPAPFERPMVSAHPGPMLPEAQLDLIRKWVDLGAIYDDEVRLGPWPYRIPMQDTFVLEGESSAK